MWFKTRVGLTSLKEPFEVRAAEYPEAKYPSYLIHARSLTDSDLNYKGIFGKLQAPGRWVHLAQFKLEEASEPEIARCMSIIEGAIKDEARICDLSECGDPEAWKSDSRNWVLIKW